MQEVATHYLLDLHEKTTWVVTDAGGENTGKQHDGMGKTGVMMTYFKGKVPWIHCSMHALAIAFMESTDALGGRRKRKAKNNSRNSRKESKGEWCGGGAVVCA